MFFLLDLNLLLIIRIVLFAIPPTGPKHVPSNFSNPCCLESIGVIHLVPELCFHISHVKSFFYLSWETFLTPVHSTLSWMLQTSWHVFSASLFSLFVASRLYNFLSIDSYFPNYCLSSVLSVDIAYPVSFPHL